MKCVIENKFNKKRKEKKEFPKIRIKRQLNKLTLLFHLILCAHQTR